jgi:hypothetical protein
VAKKYVSLLVSLNKSDMDGMEKAILVLGWIFFGHTADLSTNVLYGKDHRAGARNAGKAGKARNVKMPGGFIPFLAFLACLAFLAYSLSASKSHS